jgi:uncharacterized membrane protein YdjX (TVP38/TMEM64 family)
VLGWVLLAAVVAVIAASYAFGIDRHVWNFIHEGLSQWKAFVEENLLLAILIYFSIYVAVTALSLPVATPISLLGGALFGRWLGTAVVSAASTLGASLAFLSSRYLLRDWVRERFEARLAVINRGVEQDGAFYLFTLRLVPAVPFFIINLGMGLTPMRLSTYVLVSWMGMLPGTFLYVNAGFEAGEALATMQSAKDLLSPTLVLSLVLLGIVPLIIRKLLQWRAGK